MIRTSLLSLLLIHHAQAMFFSRLSELGPEDAGQATGNAVRTVDRAVEQGVGSAVHSIDRAAVITQEWTEESGHDTKKHTPHEMTVEQMTDCKGDNLKTPDFPLMYAELFRHGVVQVRDCLNGHQNLQSVTYSLTKPEYIEPDQRSTQPLREEMPPHSHTEMEKVYTDAPLPMAAESQVAAVENNESRNAIPSEDACSLDDEESEERNTSAQPSRVYGRDLLLGHQRRSGDPMSDVVLPTTIPLVVINARLPEGLQRMQKKPKRFPKPNTQHGHTSNRRRESPDAMQAAIHSKSDHTSATTLPSSRNLPRPSSIDNSVEEHGISPRLTTRQTGLLETLKDVVSKSLPAELQDKFRGCVVHGSVAYDMATAKSDLDVALEFSENLDQKTTGKVLTLITKEMESLWPQHEIQLIDSKIPIIRAEPDSSETGPCCQCDIKIANRLSSGRLEERVKTDIIMEFMSDDPRVKPLCMWVKDWAKQHGICNTRAGYLSSFGYLIMVIHYLKVERHGQNLDELIQGFLEYYTKFDWDTHGVSVEQNVIAQNKKWCHMLVRDPVMPDRNLGRNINNTKRQDILSKFHEQLEALQ